MSDDITTELDDTIGDEECDDPACCPAGGDHYAREIPRSDQAGIGWRCTRCNAAWSGSREHTCQIR